MDEQHLDVIAVGAHPDDVEIGCGGTLAGLVERGYRVGIIDLTDGEPTPGARGAAVRLGESRRAAEILGVRTRVNLDLPNRRLFDSFEARLALAREFRRHRPRLVLGPRGRTPMASPDHYQAMLITEAAVFYCRLSNWDEHFDGLPAHVVGAYMQYSLNARVLVSVPSGYVVVDISHALEKKLAAVAAYKSQFPPERHHRLDRIRIFNQQQGLAADFAAGEVLSCPTTLGTRDLMGMLFGPGDHAAATPDSPAVMPTIEQTPLPPAQAAAGIV